MPEEPKDDTDLGGAESGREPEVDFQTLHGFPLSPMGDNDVFESSPSSLVAPNVFLPKWNLSRESLLMQHLVMYEWSHHALPLATIKASKLLSNSHMANNLQYAVAQVAH